MIAPKFNPTMVTSVIENVPSQTAERGFQSIRADVIRIQKWQLYEFQKNAHFETIWLKQRFVTASHSRIARPRRCPHGSPVALLTFECACSVARFGSVDRPYRLQ
jgi:hypothetical protein